MNTEEDTFLTYRRRRSRYTEEFEDIQLEDTNLDMDPTWMHSDRGKGTGEDESKMEFRSLVNALHDLTKGQEEVLHAINRLAMKPEPGHSSVPLSPVDRGSTSSSGKHAYTNMQNTPHIYNRPSSRPTMPHFLADSVAGPVMPVEPSEPFGAYLQEYRDLGDEFRVAMYFSYFCNMKSRNRPRNFNRGFNQNYELQKTLGRVTIPNIDGARGGSARIWVQKLDTY